MGQVREREGQPPQEGLQMPDRPLETYKRFYPEGGAPILASYSSLSRLGTENLWGGGWTLQWFPKGLADVTASPVLLG